MEGKLDLVQPLTTAPSRYTLADPDNVLSDVLNQLSIWFLEIYYEKTPNSAAASAYGMICKEGEMQPNAIRSCFLFKRDKTTQ